MTILAELADRILRAIAETGQAPQSISLPREMFCKLAAAASANAAAYKISHAPDGALHFMGVPIVEEKPGGSVLNRRPRAR